MLLLQRKFVFNPSWKLLISEVGKDPHKKMCFA